MASGLVVDFHTAQFEFRQHAIMLWMTDREGKKVVQSGELARGLLPNEKPDVCHGDDFDQVTFTWAKFGSVVISHHPHGDKALEYRVRWTLTGKNRTSGQLRDAYLLGPAHWYGAAQVRRQHWPVEKWSRPETAYVAGDSFQDQYGGVLERYWLSSNGVALVVDADLPLFVGMNHKTDNMLTLACHWSSPYKNLQDKPVTLNYRIFVAPDVRQAHELATSESFKRPTDIPDELLFRHPIWSTWARYKKNINQDIVVAFAKDIKENGFNASQVEVDDDWTPHYGDMQFNLTKFPDPKKMVADIKELGFRTTLWVHPFASPLSQAAGGDYWIRSGILPGHTTWWNGVGKLLDVTNPEAVTWFKGNLQRLKDAYDLASFKFDAGEVNWLPKFATPKTPWSSPNDYTERYAQMCYDCDPDLRALEVRVGSGTQHLPIFVRMMDKDSNWTFENGLKSLIPHALTFGVLGYPFVLPDMVGGNAYSGMNIGSSSALPEPELFVRWMQANVFLPAIQFSLCPWQYTNASVDGKPIDVVKISREMTALHERYADTFVALARESVTSGAPIVRPLWWVAPHDERAQVIDDQFLVGDDIVVAPVVVRGALSRDVYLPPGRWRDELRGEVLDGGKEYRNYKADLHELPYFTRVKAGADASSPADDSGDKKDIESEAVAETPAETGTGTETAAETCADTGTSPEANAEIEQAVIENLASSTAASTASPDTAGATQATTDLQASPQVGSEGQAQPEVPAQMGDQVSGEAKAATQVEA